MKLRWIAVPMILLACGSSVFAQTRAERIVTCSEVDQREPVGVTEVFPAGTEEIVAFVQLADVDCNCTVSFVFSHEGREVRTIIVPVMREARWRTWARKNVAGLPGEWAVEVRDASNKPLISTMFRVE